jgi:hypothetical protein
MRVDILSAQEKEIMKLTEKQKKIQIKMLSGISEYELNRVPTHIELMNNFLLCESLKKFKKYKKKIKRSKRVLGMGEATKLTVKSKQSKSLERSTAITKKFRGLRDGQ